MEEFIHLVNILITCRILWYKQARCWRSHLKGRKWHIFGELGETNFEVVI